VLIDQVLSRDNLLLAHKKVVSNKGAPGVDGITVDELWGFCQENWEEIRTEITKGTYQPKPVRKVEIPKPGGGKRVLGIPCVIDRLILQALNQVLTPIFDVGFSESSFGFRPGKSAHDALKQAGKLIAAGYTWVVNIDLEKFFDRVNHDMLMVRLARKIEDKLVLKLIRQYLQAGIMDHGIVQPRLEGTVQGAPLSPLLSNIMLDDLDKELEKRGHRYCRFADDFNIYVKSERAGQRVMGSIEQYLWKKLRLPINKEKSEVLRSSKHTFLGYSFYGYKNPQLSIAPKSITRLKGKIRQSLRKWRGMNIQKVIGELNQMIQGWVVYFRLANGKVHLEKLETWILRHLRCIQWRQWKTPRTRFNKLLSFDVNRSKAARVAWGRGGPWFSSATSAMNFSLTHAYFNALGWLGIINLYNKFKINVKFV
jgi:RNA-directed DNA polymerase